MERCRRNEGGHMRPKRSGENEVVEILKIEVVKCILTMELTNV